jgi:hypothetical protein
MLTTREIFSAWDPIAINLEDESAMVHDRKFVLEVCSNFVRCSRIDSSGNYGILLNHAEWGMPMELVCSLDVRRWNVVGSYLVYMV